MTTTRLDTTFYRLRIIQPITTLFYFGSGLVLWAFLDAPIGGVFIWAYMLLEIIHAVLPTSLASGYWLAGDGFLIRRGPFGQRCAHYGYDGFLRLLVMPAGNKTILVFDADKFKQKPLSTLARRFPLYHLHGGYAWLVTPSTISADFPAALLERATRVVGPQDDADLSAAYRAFLLHRRRGLRGLLPF